MRSEKETLFFSDSSTVFLIYRIRTAGYTENRMGKNSMVGKNGGKADAVFYVKPEYGD